MESFGPAGAQLWAAVTARYEPNGGEQEILLGACRTVDLLERLAEEERRRPGLLVLMAEARKQAQLLLQLMAALRLPEPVTGKRPQYRGPRGAYRPRAVTPATRTTSPTDRSTS